MISQLLSGLFFLFLRVSGSSQAFPPPLSKEDEEKYIMEFQKGNAEARNILIEHNLRLVAHIVKKFENKKKNKTM